MSEHEEKSITIKKSDLWKYATFVLVAVVIIGGFMAFKGDSGNGGTGVGAGTDTGANNPSPINAKALIEANDPVLGSADAGITVIEFSDFQCVFCEKAYSGAVTDLKNSNYFKNGEVNFIYKQMPLDTACNTGLRDQLHPNACKAAEASLCAQEQGKFWEYHDKLFPNQAALAVTDLKSYASQLKLDTTKFNKCLGDAKYASEVKKEIAQGASAGGTGTPFFVVVNTKTGKSTSFAGAYPFTKLEEAIKSVQ